MVNRGGFRGAGNSRQMGLGGFGPQREDQGMRQTFLDRQVPDSPYRGGGECSALVNDQLSVRFSEAGRGLDAVALVPNPREHGKRAEPALLASTQEGDRAVGEWGNDPMPNKIDPVGAWHPSSVSLTVVSGPQFPGGNQELDASAHVDGTVILSADAAPLGVVESHGPGQNMERNSGTSGDVRLPEFTGSALPRVDERLSGDGERGRCSLADSTTIPRGHGARDSCGIIFVFRFAFHGVDHFHAGCGQWKGVPIPGAMDRAAFEAKDQVP